MKQMLLAALLASIASSAMTLLLAGALRPAPAPAAPALTAGDFKGALAELERQVAALRRTMEERGTPGEYPPGETPATAAGTPVPGPASEEAGVLPPTSPGAVPRARRAPAAVDSPAAQLQRFREIFPKNADGDVDEDVRRERVRAWLFHGEREVMDWFGLPLNVQGEGEKETWSYEIPTGTKDEDGNPEHESFTIIMNRGRLIGLEY